MECTIPGRQSDSNFCPTCILLAGKSELPAGCKILEENRGIRPGNHAKGGDPEVHEQGIGSDFPRGTGVSEYFQYV